MKTETGDLLALKRGIIAHQVNTVGATGGLAGALRRKWPLAFRPYYGLCSPRSQTKPMGTAVLGEAHPGLYVAHVFGQRLPGPNTDLAAVDTALADLAEKIHANPELAELPVYFPHLIGCGLGGGRWEHYLPLLEKHFPSATIIQLPA